MLDLCKKSSRLVLLRVAQGEEVERGRPFYPFALPVGLTAKLLV